VVSVADPLAPESAQRYYDRALAARWGLSVDTFTEALVRSVRGRFGDAAASKADVTHYLDGVHVADLALACACAEGKPEAWDHFVLEFRPLLYRTAESLRVPGDARELADGLYAELFGLEQRDGVRRSLFRYYHGRSSLAGWLRTVLAQRAVDRARAGRRLVPLTDDRDAATQADRATSKAIDALRARNAPNGPIDPHRPELLAALRSALAAALAALEPRARLRLALYYTKGLKLVQIGRLTGESEATVSRKLEKARGEIRAHVERRLREGGLGTAQVALCFEYAQDDPQFDLSRALPVPDS
jgi:RNA polymerase sigma-70 factor (ECF subfamily)